MGIFDRISRKAPKAEKEPVVWITLECRFTLHHARGAAQGILTAYGPEEDVDDGYGGFQPSARTRITGRIFDFRGEVLRDGYQNGPEWISPLSIQSIVFADENEVVSD